MKRNLRFRLHSLSVVLTKCSSGKRWPGGIVFAAFRYRYILAVSQVSRWGKTWTGLGKFDTQFHHDMPCGAFRSFQMFDFAKTESKTKAQSLNHRVEHGISLVSVHQHLFALLPYCMSESRIKKRMHHILIDSSRFVGLLNIALLNQSLIYL